MTIVKPPSRKIVDAAGILANEWWQKLSALFDVANSLAPVATSGSASDLSTGTLPAAGLPNPSATTLGGVKSLASASHKFLTQIGTDGSVSQAQPASADITATATNDSAAAGYVGEIITSNIAVGSAVSISNATPTNVTSISLTAGDWDVYGWVSTNPAGGTTQTSILCGISTTTANLGSFPTRVGGMSVSPGSQISVPAPTQRISLSGTTTVYLVVQVGFSVSTNAAFGYVTGRRAR